MVVIYYSLNLFSCCERRVSVCLNVACNETRCSHLSFKVLVKQLGMSVVG